MLTLLDDRFAPLTSSVGFLRRPLDQATEALRDWRERIHGTATATALAGTLERVLPSLEPLTNAGPRELLVATANPEWTAVFDCGVNGGDQISSVGYLSRTVHCQGLVVCAVGYTPYLGPDRPGRYYGLQFQMFGPRQTHFLNYVRGVSLVQDGDRWHFDVSGEVQDFERVDAYSARAVRERFTEQMMIDYCAALGLRPFDEDFYPGPAALVVNPALPRPGTLVLTLAQAQKRLGLTSPTIK